MDQYPVKFKNMCDYGSLKAINTLIKEDRFLLDRNVITVKTPFGELLKMDHKLCIQNHVALNAVKAWNGKKLVIGNKEYEIDSELVKKSLSLSIDGTEIIKPNRDENHVPIFIKQAIPQMCKDRNRKKFNKHVVAVFRSIEDAGVIGEFDEIVKLSKLYVALIFSALLFPRSKRILLEYLYLLDDSHFDDLKSYRFDIEVAKFLRDGIQIAKNAKTKSAGVSGCLHIIECLYSQEKHSMIPSQNKRERQTENDVEVNESTAETDTPLSLKRPRTNTGNFSEEYRLKKEPRPENPKTEVIDIEDSSSEEDVNEEEVTGDEVQSKEVPKPFMTLKRQTDDEVQSKEVPKPFMTLKRETIDKAPSSFEYIGPGQPFVGRHSSDCVVLNDGKCENVGGFSVLKSHARFYEEIWMKYGYIASNKVLKDSNAQVPVVSGIMDTIVHMHYCRFSDLTSRIIEGWEDNMKNAEKLEFNIGWVGEWLECVKKVFSGKEKLAAAFIEQDELLLQAEKKKSMEAKNAYEEAEKNIVALETKMSLLTKERQEYEEKDSELLSLVVAVI
ncbi:hypothetical protein MKX03_026417 [Papaver bracteatum]|nr:hypothetical protein MKX03_026417 [Papaver bracteatum]